MNLITATIQFLSLIIIIIGIYLTIVITATSKSITEQNQSVRPLCITMVVLGVIATVISLGLIGLIVRTKGRDLNIIPPTICLFVIGVLIMSLGSYITFVSNSNRSEEDKNDEYVRIAVGTTSIGAAILSLSSTLNFEIPNSIPE
jgi:hypothetical protein